MDYQRMKSNYWENKKVVITGGFGFLGSHFVKKLKTLNASVVPTSHNAVDLLDCGQTKAILKGADVVINCAALDGNAEFKTKHDAEILDCNLRIVSNILNAAKTYKIQDVVLISSVDIYSLNVPNPLSEDVDYRNYNDHTSNGYILSKKFGEILSDLYAKEYGLRIYTPRPSNIYGSNDHFNEATNRVIPSFIRKVYSDEPIEIWGDGSQTRQFIYVDDVVRVILAVVEKGYTNKLNISTDDHISIMALAQLIYQLFNKKPNIVFDVTKNVGTKNRILDISKMCELIDFTPISLKKGLTETIEWYKKHLII